jgi:microcystin-dependent protein
MDEYMAVIKLFGFNWAPKNWMLCSGQIIGISQNSALFALLGTTYGGNGTSTFALPNIQGRTVVGQGTGAGIPNKIVGEMSGTESITILSTQMPQHTHLLAANTGAGTTGVPTNGILSASPKNGSGPSAVSLNTYTSNSPDTTLSPQTIGFAGGSQPISIMQPYIALNYSICLYGIFPSRN